MFGELALQNNAPRAATIKADSESLLWVLDSNTFNNIKLLQWFKNKRVPKIREEIANLIGQK